MNKKLRLLLPLMLLLNQIDGLAQSTSSLVTADMPLGARSLGMGGAYTAMANDGSAFAWNAGGVSLNKSSIVSGMYGSHHGTIGTALANVLHCGAVLPFEDVAFSVDWLRYQSADQRINPDLRTDISLAEHEAVIKANQDVIFAPQAEDAFCLSIARDNILTIDFGWSQYQLPIEFPVGITMRYVRESANGATANGLVLDAGAMMRINLRDMFFSDDYPRLSFSWALKNIGGSSITWSTGHRDHFAYRYAIGIAMVQPIESLSGDLTLSYDYHSRDVGTSRIGAEWLYKKTYALRAGLLGSAVTAGIGVDIRFLIVDYAYQLATQTMLGDIHRLNCTFRLEYLFRQGR